MTETALDQLKSGSCNIAVVLHTAAPEFEADFHGQNRTGAKNTFMR